MSIQEREKRDYDVTEKVALGEKSTVLTLLLVSHMALEALSSTFWILLSSTLQCEMGWISLERVILPIWFFDAILLRY
jgi:hypothetical protein